MRQDPDPRLLTVGPARVYGGNGVLADLGPAVSRTASRVAIVTGATAWRAAATAVESTLSTAGVATEVLFYGKQVSESTLESLCFEARGVDAIVGVGGGKALDAAKLAAHRLEVPAYMVPTSAATCAAWTALSNVYSDEGGWLYGVPLEQGPRAVFLDHGLVLDAPVRLLAAGVADAMAKWYESDSAVDLGSADATSTGAVELSHHLHKQLVRHAKAALSGDRAAGVRVADLNVILTGAVSGLGGSMCRSVAAHAVANGLTHLPGASCSLHGEKVAFGLLVQFVLQDRDLSEIEEFIAFLADLRLPLTLESLGLPDTRAALDRAVAVAMAPDSTLHRLPVAVDAHTLGRAILEADALARRTLAEHRQEALR